MAEVGKNAEFVNFGSSAKSESGNVLIDTLSAIPEMLKKLDIENSALNGKPFADELSNLVASIAKPIKGDDNAKALPDAEDEKGKTA